MKSTPNVLKVVQLLPTPKVLGLTWPTYGGHIRAYNPGQVVSPGLRPDAIASCQLTEMHFALLDIANEKLLYCTSCLKYP